MFSPLLPQRADNTYRGSKLGLWLFGLLMLMKVVISVRSIFDGYAVASTADGIPLDTFTSTGAQTVVSLFALLGLARLVICLMGIVVLIRYRALVPLMYVLLLLEHVGKESILRVLPIARTGVPPGLVVNLVLLGLMIVGFALSVWRKDDL